MFFDNVDIGDYICFFFKDDKCYVFYKYYEKVWELMVSGLFKGEVLF